MYTEKISLIEDDAEDAGAAAGVPDWEMSEEFLDHAKARHLLCNYRTTSKIPWVPLLPHLAMLTIVLLGYTCHSCHWLRLPRAPSRGVGVDQEVGRRSERLPHRGLAARHTAPGRASQGKWVLSEQKGTTRTFSTFARHATCLLLLTYTAQAVYNLWVAVAFMWGWAAAIIIIGLPLYEHRSAVNNGPFLSSARARLLCLDCYACARRLCLPRPA